MIRLSVSFDPLFILSNFLLFGVLYNGACHGILMMSIYYLALVSFIYCPIILSNFFSRFLLPILTIDVYCVCYILKELQGSHNCSTMITRVTSLMKRLAPECYSFLLIFMCFIIAYRNFVYFLE